MCSANGSRCRVAIDAVLGGAAAALIVAVALLIGWVISGCGNWKLGKGRAALVCFCGFWMWALLSTLFSLEFGKSAEA